MSAPRPRVVLFGKSDSLGGGASKCATLLAEGLAAEGHQADHFTIHPVRASASTRTLTPTLAPVFRLLHKVSRRALGAETIPWELPFVRAWPRLYDVAHLHDHWHAVSPLTLRWLAARMPLVVTLHDASYFTGGCLYPEACDRYTRHCGDCPSLAELRMPLDTTRLALRFKRPLLADPRVTLTAPSAWMIDLARRSPWLAREPSLLVNAARTENFQPAARASARPRFGLAEQDRVVLVGASSLADPRKGAALAIEALNQLHDPRLRVLLLGHPAPALVGRLRHRHVSAGYLSADADLAGAYAAADLFLFPSSSDNCPLSVIESLCCGTPVICRPRGGSPELLRPGLDGEVVSPDTPAALAEGVSSWLESGRANRDEIARAAAARFNLSRYTRDHLALYERALHARHRQL